ncbi:hypothetical protein GCHA_2129 [Paraglaciecola chathamensis S18K6]|uniref:Uncharacterized protein n=1 Tax=Paraglaciecola chathamensis S18K6 TaxID=1127672 RepID=A0AAV3V048_9ALTE|nr:hypothetical protein GCHA_2129 [Paraglaciecola chathamensis S18K6]
MLLFVYFLYTKMYLGHPINPFKVIYGVSVALPLKIMT